MTIALDSLDQKAASVYDGYLVRKDLVRRYSRQYPVPTYVVEFLLGRYCASTNEQEIAEGLQIVEKQLKDRTVRTGDQEIFKARARDTGPVKLIDLVKARLDTRNDRYDAELPSLGLRDVRIADNLVREHERMLTDGFYAEVTLSYDAIVAQQQGGRPFAIDAIRPIQMSKSDVLDVYEHGRRSFTTEEWVALLLRSIGLEPATFNDRAKRVALLRMVPFVERNYNLVELGPRGTGRGHAVGIGHVDDRLSLPARQRLRDFLVRLETDGQEENVGLDGFRQCLGNDHGADRGRIGCKAFRVARGRHGDFDALAGKRLGEGVAYLTEADNCIAHDVSPCAVVRPAPCRHRRRGRRR